MDLSFPDRALQPHLAGLEPQQSGVQTNLEALRRQRDRLGEGAVRQFQVVVQPAIGGTAYGPDEAAPQGYKTDTEDSARSMIANE